MMRTIAVLIVGLLCFAGCVPHPPLMVKATESQPLVADDGLCELQEFESLTNSVFLPVLGSAPSADDWYVWVSIAVIAIGFVAVLIVKAFAVDSRYVHKREFEKLERTVDEHDTDFIKKADVEKLATRLDELEKEVAHIPTDHAREAKLIDEFSKLAKSIEASQTRPNKDQRKP